MKKWLLSLFFLGLSVFLPSSPISVLATENTYSGPIESAPYSDENKTIVPNTEDPKNGYPTYYVEGLTNVGFNAVFGRTYIEGQPELLTGGNNYLLLAIDPAKDANNGWTLIHENDVKSWIAYYARTNNSRYLDFVASKLSKISVKAGISTITFYNHAEVAEIAGGQAGTYSLEPVRDANGQIIDQNKNGKPDYYKSVIRNVKRYEDVYPHSLSLDIPSTAKAGDLVTIQLSTTDGSFYILRQQHWTVYVHWPVEYNRPAVKLMDMEAVYLSGHEANRTLQYVFSEPGEYRITFSVEDASYHDDYRTGTNRYSVSKTITVEPLVPPPEEEEELRGPVADFTWSPGEPKAKSSAQFIDQSYHPDGVPIVSWKWYIGGSSLSSQRNPKHTFTSAGTYNVMLVVTDANGKTDAAVKPVPVSPSSGPIACIAAPSTVIAGDMVSIRSCSTDPDGEIVEYIWDWTGKGTWMAGGELENNSESGYLVFMQPGSRMVFLTVRDNDGLTDSTEHMIDVLTPYPIAIMDVRGTLKENRKVILDASPSYGQMGYPIDKTKTTWEITPLDGQAVSSIKFKGNTNIGHTKEVLFKELGRYNILLKVYNTYGTYGVMVQNITIVEDLPPVIRYTVPELVYRNPTNNNKATFILKDNSYSPDGDIIQQRIWSVLYDSQNDGRLDNDTWVIIDSSNLSEVKFEATEVGDYYFRLEIVEGFGQETIPEFITEQDYRRATD